MSLIPRTLFGRLVVVLLAAFVGLQILVGAIMFSRGPADFSGDPRAGGQIAETLSALALSLAALDDARIDGMRDELARRGVRVLASKPDRAGGDQDATPLVQALVHALRQAGVGPQLLWAQVVSAADTDTAGAARQQQLSVALRLSDARYLVYSAKLPERREFRFPPALLLDVAVRLVVVALIALLLTRWLVSPLKRLAEQANKLGRDLGVEPMPESGSIEVRESARAFNAMQSRISTLLDERTRMLSAISHDLRTPITRVLLRLEMSPQTPERDRSIADLSQLTAMINDTLQYVRSDATSPPAEPLDFSQLVARCVDGMDKRLVTLHPGPALWIRGKAMPLQRMIGNLVDNAIRYGRSATIRVYPRDRQCVFEVVDAGPGIPEALLERVLEPFFRVDSSRNPDAGGTGLGLSIARDVVLAHGGEIRLRNRATGGLGVTVSLPRVDAP